ncbi:MAG: sulfur reduction protein DsrS [Chromatiales bacterium]|nr:sulfur reduction protein DsrS [Chromatiales bacterium]
MELSAEDSLRLNVLLAQNLHAVRIDESNLIVYALSDKGEAKVQLNPNCKDEKYIKMVKELFSTHVLGSPGGYPIYLRRWTRMGQQRADNLEKLLLLGEPEAVVAVVYAAGITDEVARRAWWAMPSSENARRMLDRQEVVDGEMGPVLSEFLVEFMPFEEEPLAQMESVRLVLQTPGLIDEATRESIWKKANRKNAFYVGFLASQPDDLPDPVSAHAEYETVHEALAPLVEADNPFAKQFLRLLSTPGQTYLSTVEKVLKKPSNQDVVVRLFDTVRDYFESVRQQDEPIRELAEIERIVGETLAKPPEALQQVLTTVPDQKTRIESMLFLSLIGERLVAPIFALTDAVGSVMRKKIEPVATPILEHIGKLVR